MTVHPPRDPVYVEVAIGTTSWAGAAPSRVWIADFRLPWGEARRVREELEQLLVQHPMVPHIVDERGARFSWGGDSSDHLSVWLLLADYAANGFIGAAAAAIFERLRSRQRSRDVEAEAWRQPLTRDGAIEQAKWIVATKYRKMAERTQDPDSGDQDELKLLADQWDANSELWTITLSDAHGATYRVSLGRVAGIQTPILIERELPPS